PGAVPELQVQRADPYSRPARRTRDFAPFELLLDLGDPLLEALPGFHRFGLLGGPRSDLAAATAAGEVRVRLLVGDQLHRPFDADLHPFVHARPVEYQCGLAVVLQFAPLAAIEVGIEDETAGVM